MFAEREPVANSHRRSLVYIAGYLILWPVLDELAKAYAGAPGFSSWYLGGALDVLLFLFCGPRWWPLAIAAGLIRWGAFPHHPGEQLLPVLLSETLIALGYALAVQLLVRYFKVSFPLRGVRGVAYFCGIAALAAPLCVGAASVLVMAAFGGFSWSDALLQYRRFVFGDAIGIIVLVPAVTVLIEWNAMWTALLTRRRYALPELIAGAFATFAVVGCGYALAPGVGGTLLDLSFVPLAWLAIRFGMSGAIIGILVADATSTALHFLRGSALLPPGEHQGFLIASALLTLLLGAAAAERDELTLRLERHAYVDDLTGLPNRGRILEWIQSHRDVSITLVILDVDDMRVLNEGVGRIAADGMLRTLAMRLRNGLPTSYFVARLNAGEFAIAAIDDRSPHALVSELRTFFETPFDVEGSRLFVSTSMGAVRMADFGSADELLRKADLALRRAKLTPTRAVVYSIELQSGGAPSLVGELHRAVERNEFVLFFQPIFAYDTDTQSWRVAGAEALLRWAHPERGIVAAGDFIEFLERLAICERIGWTVVEQSLAQAAIWRENVPDFRIWVNLFGRQAVQLDCAKRIEAAINASGLPCEALVVEISERLVASDEREVAALVRSLKQIGVASAIDDFGTGGSSFGRVSDVPAEVIKIDRTFVNRSEVDAKAKAVATAIVRLSAELGMTVLAEGVESALQVDVMLDIGCKLAQGYALGHPLPAELFTQTVLAVPAQS